MRSVIDRAARAAISKAARWIASAALPAFASMLLLSGAAPALAREGVDVGPPSIMSKVVSAERIENESALQYRALLARAAQSRALAPSNLPQVVRLRVIAARLIPFSYEWNPAARRWTWQVNVIASPQINAFCMPGGKIAFYLGILEKLKLSDDEIAIVMGHEMTHALREHARAQIGKRAATRGIIELGSALAGLGNGGRLIANAAGDLLTLRFGRADESEADLVGLELAARAGYDPRAGVTLWQKMAAANRQSSLEFLSTHPSGPTRISDIQAALPKVMPLYAGADKPQRRFDPMTGR